MNKTMQFLFVFILVICAINFFNFQKLNGSIFRYIQFGYMLVAILMSFPYFTPKKEGFVLPVQLICVSIIFSILLSWLTWNQSIDDSITGSIPILVWMVFFFMKHLNFPISKIENILVFYGILYCILYFFQFIHSDKNYFINTEEVDISRGIARIIFPGRGVFYFTIFLAINKLTTVNKNRWFWAGLAALGLVVNVMQVTRQFIFGTLIIYLIHFLRNQSFFKKFLIIGCSLGILYYIVNTSDSTIVKGLARAQEDNMVDASNYVRIKAASFFITQFSNSPINRIFGNGVPYGKNSDYNIYTDWYSKNYGYYLSDVGLISLYAMFGVLAVLGYIIIWIKSFTIHLPSQYYYLKYYLWFLLFTSLTSDTIYAAGDLITTVFVVYSYQTVYENYKYENLDNNFNLT